MSSDISCASFPTPSPRVLKMPPRVPRPEMSHSAPSAHEAERGKHGDRDVAAEPAEQSALPSPRGRKVVWDVRPRNLDQHSGLREAPEGASSRGSTASLQRAALNGQTGGFRPN